MSTWSTTAGEEATETFTIWSRVEVMPGAQFQVSLRKCSEISNTEQFDQRNVRLRGKHKLSDKWEQDTFVVVSRAGELPVYRVKPEDKDGPVRMLHRDLLLPCGFLPSKDNQEVSCEEVASVRPWFSFSNLNLSENDIPVPVSLSSHVADQSSPSTPPSVGPVNPAVVLDEESSVEEDSVFESQNENLPVIFAADSPAPVHEVIPGIGP